MKNPFSKKGPRESDPERRNLVGRRYEDYIKNDIRIELASEEHSWRMLLSDPRYSVLLDRRRKSRRTSDRPPGAVPSVFKSCSSFAFIRDPFDEFGFEE